MKNYEAFKGNIYLLIFDINIFSVTKMFLIKVEKNKLSIEPKAENK